MTERRQIRLTTRGRRSGKPRTVTLYAWPEAESLIIVASAGGRASHPAWALNLRDTANADVQEGKRQWTVRAHEATGRERERLWQLVTAAFPLYATYQHRTSRTLPLFILQPAAPD